MAKEHRFFVRLCGLSLLFLVACSGGRGCSARKSSPEAGGRPSTPAPEATLTTASPTARPTPAGVYFYVSPKGNDAASGRNPSEAVSTWSQAQSLVRSARARGEIDKPVFVIFLEGEYALATPVELTPEDSGTAEMPVTFKAEDDAKVVFSGGWQAPVVVDEGQGEWEIPLPEGQGLPTSPEQMWVNGVRAQRARHPNLGSFAYVVRSVAGFPKQKFVVDSTLASRLQGLSQAELAAARVVMRHSWDVTMDGISAFEAASSEVTLAHEMRRTFFEYGSLQRFHIENLRTALDAPGEFFVDTAQRKIRYRPRPGEVAATARVVVPRLEALVKLTGNAWANPPKLVEHVRLEGLSFRYSGHAVPANLWEGHQAARDTPGAIEIQGAKNVAITRCEVSQTGAYGIFVVKGVTDARVSACHLHDLGAGGVEVGPFYGSGADLTARVQVDNNLIHSGGYVYPEGVGVLLGSSSDDVVEHNEISDLSYSGISVGWKWGYDESPAFGNRIAFNRIFNVGRYELSDLGGIYTLGISPGTVVANNLIHDVHGAPASGAPGFGIYNDEGSSQIVMENNLTYDTQGPGYHLHFGKDNTVRNNIFAFAEKQQVRRSDPEAHSGFEFNNNIVYSANATDLISGPIAQETFRSNLYFNTTGAAKFVGQTLAQWQAAGRDAQAVEKDPSFADAAARDFRFSAASPYRETGFVPFDLEAPGLSTEAPADLVAAAQEQRKAPKAMPPVENIPVNFSEGFESFPSGVLPAFSLKDGGRPDSIAVSTAQARTGSQSLRFLDGPDLGNSWDPHMFFNLMRRSGVLRLKMDLFFEDTNGKLYIDWRDYGSGGYSGDYASALMANFVGTSLRYNGRTDSLATFPTGQWLHLEMSAALGDAAPRTWGLSLEGGGFSFSRQDLPVRTGFTGKTTWVGIVSDATVASTFYLDNLSLVSE